MNDLHMRVQLTIYQGSGSGLNLSEEIVMPRFITLEEAARILTKFSELARLAAESAKTGSLRV